MGLNAFDLAIIAIYLVGITLFGLRFRKQQRSLRDYFLADRNVPWWAIALSIVAAETSTLTIISIPGLAYDTNLGFLQVVLGYLVARLVISSLFIPHYFRGEMFTAYQLIERRFGQRLRSVTAGLFLFTRAAAEGVRVVAIALVVGIALGTGELASIVIITVLTLIYTFEGGMTAVIWTDVVQMVIYVGGTIVGFFTLLHLIPGGWPQVMALAGDKFAVFHFSFDPTRAYTFWAGLLGGTFLTTASHGTDQLMVQRLLAARSERQSKTALLSSGLAILFQFSLFLVVGVLLYVFYKVAPQLITFTRSDQIFPTFIVREMPHGISGLLIAAILAAAMSNLSAALNSLSSSTVMDFYLRFRPHSTDEQRIRVSRIATLFWSITLFGLAVLTQFGGQRVLELGLSIASVPYGGLLGVFLLGTLTSRVDERSAIFGMVCGVLTNLLLWTAPRLGWVEPSHTIAWTWYVVIGSAITFGVAYAASMMRSNANRAAA